MVQRNPTTIVNVEPSAQLPYTLYDEGPSLEDCDWPWLLCVDGDALPCERPLLEVDGAEGGDGVDGCVDGEPGGVGMDGGDGRLGEDEGTGLTQAGGGTQTRKPPTLRPQRSRMRSDKAGTGKIRQAQI